MQHANAVFSFVAGILLVPAYHAAERGHWEDCALLVAFAIILVFTGRHLSHKATRR